MRFKWLAVCCAAVAAAAMLVGCASQEPYTPPEATPVVSSPAIGEDGVLRVGVNSQAAPLAGNSSSGELLGFDVDLAAALADELGLKVEVVDVEADGEAALQDGEVDIVLGVVQDTADSSMWESEPYLQTAVALFAAAGNTTVPTTENSPTIATQTSSTSAWLAENEFGSEALTRVGGLTQAFDALGSGQVQYVAADAVRGTYSLNSSSNTVSASIVALMQQPSGYCVICPATNTELSQAIEQALSTLLDGGFVGVLDKKWLGTDWDLSAVPLTAGATSANLNEATQETEADAEAETETEAGSNAVTPSQVAAS